MANGEHSERKSPPADVGVDENGAIGVWSKIGPAEIVFRFITKVGVPIPARFLLFRHLDVLGRFEFTGHDDVVTRIGGGGWPTGGGSFDGGPDGLRVAQARHEQKRNEHEQIPRNHFRCVHVSPCTVPPYQAQEPDGLAELAAFGQAIIF